jgi:hypothetical protein
VTRLAQLLALAALCALLGFLALGSQVPYALNPSGAALIRLSWRAHGEAALHCRTPSAEELARLPVHMRRREICERRLPSFQLAVQIDDRDALDERIAPAGAHGDRPAVVLRELWIPPGAHELRVAFTAIGGEAPPRQLERTLQLERGDVALVMEDPDLRTLVLRTSSP